MAEPNQQDVAAPDFEKDDREAFRQTYKPETRTPPISGAGGIWEMDPLARYRQYQQIFKPLTDETQARYQDLIKGRQASATKLAELQGQQQEIMAKGEAEQAQFDLNRQRTAYEDLQKKRAENPLPPFVPTQDTAQDLVNVFGMIGILGSLLGTKGTQSGIGAMNAMTGMLTGYKQGRKDLYDRELSTFKEKIAQMKEERADWEKAYSEAKELSKTDLNAALATIKLKAAEKGSEILKAQADMGRWDLVSKTIESQDKLQQNLINKVLSAEQKAGKMLEAQIPNSKDVGYYDPTTKEFLKNLDGSYVIPARGKYQGGSAYALGKTYGIPTETINRLTKDELSEASGVIESSRETYELANLIEQNPYAAGVAGKFLSAADKYLVNRYGKKDLDPNSAKNAATDGKSFIDEQSDPDATPDQITMARVISKKALDVVNARALAVSKRLLVSELTMQKQAIGLESLSSKSAPTAYRTIANGDLEKLEKIGFDKETINDLSRKLFRSQQPTIGPRGPAVLGADGSNIPSGTSVSGW